LIGRSSAGSGMMFVMPRPRLCLAFAAIAALTTACSPSGGSTDPTTTSPAGTTTTTTPEWVGGPEEAHWWAVDAICHAANDTALADAREVLTLDTRPDRADLAGYYRRRADQVDALVEELSSLTPPAEAADGWSDALAGLTRYATWARRVADTVAADGLEADQTPDPGLEAFRTLMVYGACHILLDVN
jgi:hypothetical protein